MDGWMGRGVCCFVDRVIKVVVCYSVSCIVLTVLVGLGQLMALYW